MQTDKKMARTDWSRRPLPAAARKYAQLDTHYLLHIADELRARLLSCSEPLPESKPVRVRASRAAIQASGVAQKNADTIPMHVLNAPCPWVRCARACQPLSFLLFPVSIASTFLTMYTCSDASTMGRPAEPFRLIGLWLHR